MRSAIPIVVWLAACGSPARQEAAPHPAPEVPPGAQAPLSPPPPLPPSPSQDVGCAPATRPRVVFDPAGDRHSLPDLAWNGREYLVLGYGDPQHGMVLTRLAPLRDQAALWTTSLGEGTQPSVALGARLGVVFTDFDAEPTRVEVPPPQPFPGMRSEPEPPRPDHLMVHQGQTYFLSATAQGERATARVALGDTSKNHTTPGTAIAWSEVRQEWGVAFTEESRARFVRVNASGQPGRAFDLAPGPSSHDDARVLATARGFAVPIQVEGAISLVEIEGDAVVRRTEVARDAMEPEASFDGRRVAVVLRTMTELDVVFVEGGRASARHPIARAAEGRHIGAPELAFDGASFVVVWPSGTTGFNDRLCFARLDPQGAPVPGHPVRLDDEEVSQGYASIAGTGPHLAVSYVLGNPNEVVRVGLVRGL